MKGSQQNALAMLLLDAQLRCDFDEPDIGNFLEFTLYARSFAGQQLLLLTSSPFLADRNTNKSLSSFAGSVKIRSQSFILRDL